MRYSATFLAAASLLSLAAASPLERRYEECAAPTVWHICWDGWEGCCSITPCKGPAEGVKSYCPDTEKPPPNGPPTTPGTPAQPAPPTACTPESTPSSTPSGRVTDADWSKTTGCKEDDSNCNWAATFFIVKTGNETYTTFNSTGQFHVQKDANEDGGARRDSIALFTGIPDSVTKCRINWYKPEKGIFYGTYSDGAMNISTLDLGGKPFEEVTGSKVSYENTKNLIASESFWGTLDLGNWGRTTESRLLNNGAEAFDCSGGEVAVHFSLTAAFDASVTVDQVSKSGTYNFVQRAGWVLTYE